MLAGITFIILEALRSAASEDMFYSAAKPWFSGPLLVLLVESTHLALAIVAVLLTNRNFNIFDAHRFAIPAALCVAASLLYFEVLQWVSASTISVLLNLWLPVSATLTHLVDTPSSSPPSSSVTWPGLVLVSLGTIYSQTSSRFSYDDMWAIGMCIIMALCWSAAHIMLKRTPKNSEMPFWDKQLRLSAVSVFMSLVYMTCTGGDLVRMQSEGDKSKNSAIRCVIYSAAANLAASFVAFRLFDTISCMSHAIASICAIIMVYRSCQKLDGNPINLTIGMIFVVLGAAMYNSTNSCARNASLVSVLPKSIKPSKSTSYRFTLKRALFVVLGLGIFQIVAFFVFKRSLPIDSMPLISHEDPAAVYRPIASQNKHLCFVDPRDVEIKTKNLTGMSVLDAIQDECSLATSFAMSQCRVPNVIHLVSIGGSYHFYHYLAVKSMFEKIKPDAIFIHGYDFPLNQKYFKRIIAEVRPILVYSRKAESVYGHHIELYQHRSDVIRIESMIRFGGMYFDLDVFVLKNMMPFMNSEAVMGEQRDRGINSGILIGKRCARFFRRWHAGYSTFNDSLWDEHAIVLPAKLYQQNRRDLRLEGDALRSVWPSKYIFDSKYNPADWKPIHAIHSFYRDYGKEHNDTDIVTLDNNFGRLARNLLYGGPALVE